jgi:hypothetical protein
MGEVELKEIQSDGKISKISDTHFLYENNQKLSERSKLKKGNHHIRYYSRLNGGGKLLEKFGADNVFEINPIALELLAEGLNALLIKDFLNEN